MAALISIDWEDLWLELRGRFTLGEGTIHGIDHWQRVERNGVRLADASGGNVLIARLFAAFHDVCRLNDGTDDEHGARGAALATQFRGTWFELSDADFALLHYACTWHTAGHLSDDPTIGACWDADRLDIWRAGYTPKTRYMSTAYGRKQAEMGIINFGF